MTTRTFRRLPGFSSVAEATVWCLERGLPPPTLHLCDSRVVVGLTETTPRAVHQVVRELEREGAL